MLINALSGITGEYNQENMFTDPILAILQQLVNVSHSLFQVILHAFLHVSNVLHNSNDTRLKCIVSVNAAIQ